MVTLTTPHLRLDTRTGWRAAVLDGVTTEGASGCLRLSRAAGTGIPITDKSGSFGGFTWPAGMAVDCDGRLYLIDRRCQTVRRFDPCTECFDTLPCVGTKGSAPRQFCDARGLAISPANDLWIADTGNRRVQVFAVEGLPLKAVIGQPPAAVAPKPWEPADVAFGPDRCAYVADPANDRIHVYNRSGRWLRAIEGLVRPSRLALGTGGRLYVIEDGQETVAVLDAAGKLIERVTTADGLEGRFCPVSIAVDTNGRLFVGDAYTRRVFTFEKNKPPALCRGFEGIASGIGFNRSGDPIFADETCSRLFQIPAGSAYTTAGVYVSEALDSQRTRCQWHSVVIEADMPAGASVAVETFTSEALKIDEEIAALPPDRWSRATVLKSAASGDQDCLVFSPPARYCWLRLTLRGDGEVSPSLAGVRVYYPRASSLEYLPGVYREDAASADFLDRFLSIFDSFWGKLSDTITTMSRLFDPCAVPSEFLAWLAQWMGLSLDRNWPEAKRRQLLRCAHRLYALRGTPEGMKLHVSLYTGRPAAVIEHFKLRRWLFLNHGTLGDTAALYGNAIVRRLQLGEFSTIGEFQLVDEGDPLRDPFHAYAHRFTLLVPVCRDDDNTRRTLNRIVEMAKPAHTSGTIRAAKPRFILGPATFLGIDTELGLYPEVAREGRARLGCDSLLGGGGPQSKGLGKTSRLGSSMQLG